MEVKTQLACCLLPSSTVTHRTDFHGKGGLIPIFLMHSLLFLPPFCLEIMAQTMKDFICNKRESSFNGDDVWMNFTGNIEHLIVKGVEIWMLVVVGRYLYMWYQLTGSVSDFTYVCILIWYKCESVCFSSALFSADRVKRKWLFALAWADSHSPRGTEKERGWEGQRGRKVCPFYQ